MISPSSKLFKVLVAVLFALSSVMSSAWADFIIKGGNILNQDSGPVNFDTDNDNVHDIVMQVNANLGISTTAPSGNLHVAGNVQVDEHVSLLSLASAPDQSSGNGLLYNVSGNLFFKDESGNQAQITNGVSSGLWTLGGGNVYRDTGNVGIGTSDMTSSLHVVGTAILEDTTGNPLTVKNDSQNALVVASDNTMTAYGDVNINSSFLTLDDGYSSLVTIRGRTNGDASLKILGTQGGGGGGGGISLQPGKSGATVAINDWSSGSANIVLDPNNSELRGGQPNGQVFTVSGADGSANVHASPLLLVGGRGGDHAGFPSNGGDLYLRAGLANQLGAGTDGTVSLQSADGATVLRVTANGNIGIGTTTATEGMTIAGNFLASAANTYNLGTSAVPWSNIYSKDITMVSDKRLKDDIKNLAPGLSELMRLRPVSYTWKGDASKKRDFGLIAQEVHGVLENAVNVGSDARGTMGINYPKLVPVLIKSIQELQGKVEELESSIEQMNENRDIRR